MLAVFFNSETLFQGNDVTFSCAYSKIYMRGFKKRVQKKIKIYGFYFPAFTNYHKLPKWIPLILRKTLMGCTRLLLHGPLLIYEVTVLYFLFIKIKPNILHINNGGYPAARSALAAAIAGKLASIPAVLMVVNNMAVNYWHYSRWVDYPLDLIVCKSVNLFITGSKSAAARLKAILDLPASKILSIHNGINIRPATETILETRTRLKLNGFDGAIFGVVALLIPRKGHQVLLEAILLISKQANHSAKNFKVLIEGSGPLFDDLTEFVNKHDLNKYVEFISDEENIVNFMSMIDVLILPSVADEDLPNVVLEAMALSKPVIASNIAGIAEQIIDCDTGFLVEPRNINQIADSILKLCNNEVLRTSMGQAAFSRFESFFTADIAIKNYFRMYESLIGSK